MRNNMMTIIKKELARFFGDKRMVLTTILLPGLMVYVLYSFMGDGLMNQFTADEDYVYSVYATNLPDSVSSMIDFMQDEVKIEVKSSDGKTDEQMQDEVTNKEVNMYMVFPENFDATVVDYDSMTATEAAPEVDFYYNSADVESQELYQIMTTAMDGFESSMANKFDINSGDKTYDLATDEDTTGQIFSMMLPMLLMMFLFSGCMGIAPESIAGEKERGTIATLLVTPLKRGQLALGKIVSLSIIGLLSGISSFIGTMLSLPKLMGGAGDVMNASVYKATDYMLLLFVILTTVLVIVAGLSVISAFAKSVKEASTMIMPLMIVVLVVSITSMMGNGAPTEGYWYMIPFYNSVQCMNGIFSFSYSMPNIVITMVSNLAYTLLLAGVLTKVFDSEKIMYS